MEAPQIPVTVVPVTPLLEDLFAVQLKNGRTAHICPMLFNHRINLMSNTGDYWDDCWCYEDFKLALAAILTWDTDTMSEPTGWKKHPKTGRYRPDSNPKLEYIQ